MVSESFFDNTAFFHTTYGILHFNPDSGNPLVLLFFKAVSSFPFGFFLGMHIHQAFSMYDGESQKEGESTCWPGAGSSQTEWHGVPEWDWSSDIPI